MKTLRQAALIAMLAAMTGCADKTAIQYAEDLLALLDSLIAQGGRKLADEQRRYAEEARDFVQFKDTDSLSTLRLARVTAATQTVLNQMIGGKTAGAQVLNSLLPDYAELDASTTEKIYGRRGDADVEVLERLQNLSVDRAKLKALRTAVEALAAKPSLVGQGGEYAAFARDVKGNLDFHACQELTDTIGGLEREIAGLEKQISQGSATEVARLKDALTGLQASKKAAEAKRAATGRFTSGKCGRP